jgi:nucleoside-diphosphate-sugar epimerase
MSAKQFTIFGSNGFVGSHLVRYVANNGHRVNASTRTNLPPSSTNLGHVIYAIGVTADFRHRTFDTVAAHVTQLAHILQNYQFDSFLYLSSTRLYRQADSTREDCEIRISPSDPEQFYNATKLAGEALCLTLSNQVVRVARLSNLYGAGNHVDNFLSQVLIEAGRNRRVVVRTGPRSAKDYLHVDDACLALAEIAIGGRRRVYNVASGNNVTNAEIARLVASSMKAEVNFAPDAPDIVFTPIDVSLLASEIPWRPHAFVEKFPELLELPVSGEGL